MSLEGGKLNVLASYCQGEYDKFVDQKVNLVFLVEGEY